MPAGLTDSHGLSRIPGGAMSRLTPQEIVLVEFLRYLSQTVHDEEPVVLILRGSLLMRHWFGERARPAADIDLECFERVRGGRGPRPDSLNRAATDPCRRPAGEQPFNING